MPQHERQTYARDQRAAETLNVIAEEIIGARDLVWAGWMASQHIGGTEAANALAELLDVVAQRLAAIAEKAERTGRQEGIIETQPEVAR